MRIHHFAIWCDDIELIRAFYIKYFGCESNEMYHNPTKNFTSYFLSFSEGSSKIELMNRPDITEEPQRRGFAKGMAHFDIEVEDKLKVDSDGLDETDYNFLRAIIEKFNGGPVGIDAIASAIGEEQTTIEDVYEPYLLQNGFLKRTNRGRIVTEKAYNHLNIRLKKDK